ncbi:MAG: hypothetical protein EOM87_00905 [Clostridia bacterium]|nr:hypothetical protein [Clostridia bacterium]
MTKKLIFTAIVVLIIMAVLFVGCQSYSNSVFSMGDKDAVVESNGGLVVKQGDYIYFVNGYSGYYTTNAKDNWFGNVVKGAIMRVKEGEDLATAEIIVPKSVMSAYTDSGFSIYGDFIYYVSPSAEETKSGEVMTDVIQFMRTRLDGQETRVIFQSDSTSLKYKYTPYGLVYNLDGNIYCKAFNSKHFNAKENGKIIAENVTSVYFPVSKTYDRATGETLADYFFYTKSSEDMYDYSNKLYVANASGTVNKVIINKFSYTNDPVANPSLAFSIGVVNSILENDGFTLYYTKTVYVGTSSSGAVTGLFAYKFDSALTFDKTTEVMVSSSTATKIFPLGYAGGAIVYDAALMVFKPNTETQVFSGITSVTVIGVVDNYIYYYDSGNLLYRYKMDGSDNVTAIMSDSMHTSWLVPEIVGDYIYYFNTNKANYNYRIKLSTFDRIDEESLVKELLGYMTAADAEATKEEEN